MGIERGLLFVCSRDHEKNSARWRKMELHDVIVETSRFALVSQEAVREDGEEEETIAQGRACPSTKPCLQNFMPFDFDKRKGENSAFARCTIRLFFSAFGQKLDLPKNQETRFSPKNSIFQSVFLQFGPILHQKISMNHKIGQKSSF